MNGTSPAVDEETAPYLTRDGYVRRQRHNPDGGCERASTEPLGLSPRHLYGWGE
jgi:hypothetical protein